MRMPSHLRKFAEDYDLGRWLKKGCPASQFFEDVHDFQTRLEARAGPEDDEADLDKSLVVLVAELLNWDGQVEDYVLGDPAEGHDVNQVGSVAPVQEAAAIIVVQRYRAAVKDGWKPGQDKATEGGES